MPDPLNCAPLVKELTERAILADHQNGSLATDMDLLREAGWLMACLPTEGGGAGWGCQSEPTLSAFEALRALGRANLSLARLFEGHMNAVKLVALYGIPDLRQRTWQAVSDGTLLGVWGADEPGHALALTEEGATLVLTGTKRFASGLGLVGQAVLTAHCDAGAQLLLVPVDEAARSDASGWIMSGMRATQSGTFSFDDIRCDKGALLGEPGDYIREPHFEGGIWRYCAAHLGAAEALYAAMRATLVAQGRAADPHQEVRLVQSAIAVETARLWLLRAACEVEADGAEPGKAALSLLARDVTETACLTVLAETERALGMAAHVEGTAVERIRRDLALFVCQAAPDAKRSRAAQALVASGVLPELL